MRKREWRSFLGSELESDALDVCRGFVHEGRVRKANWIDGKWEDTVMMAILDEDWEKMQAEEKKTVEEKR